MQLVACSRCNRHIRVSAERCPFCGAAAEPRLVKRLVAHGGRLSRAAIFAGTAACWSSSQPVQEGPPPPPPPPADAQEPPPTGSGTSFSQPPPGNPDPQQSLGHIEGFVTHGGRRGGVGGIQVFLNGQRVREQTFTDENGRFRFSKLVPGVYTVVLESTGHPRQAAPSQRVEVTANTTSKVNLAYVPYAPDDGPCCKPYGAPPARRRVV